MAIINGIEDVRTKTLYDENYSAQKVIPSLAAGVALVGLTTAYKLGAKVSLGTSVITSPFAINCINIEAATTNATYEVVLYEGTTAAATEISRARVALNTTVLNQNQVLITTKQLTSAKPTCAAVANSGTTAQTLAISVGYHTF